MSDDRFYEIKLRVRDGISSTTRLKLVHTSKDGNTLTYTGYQAENGVCVTLTKTKGERSIVLVTHGSDVICEFDLSVPEDTTDGSVKGEV